MSLISNKYGIKEEQFRAMVKDGIISTTWPFYEEVIVTYRSTLNECKQKKIAIEETASKFRIETRTVYRIIASI